MKDGQKFIVFLFYPGVLLELPTMLELVEFECWTVKSLMLLRPDLLHSTAITLTSTLQGTFSLVKLVDYCSNTDCIIK